MYHAALHTILASMQCTHDTALKYWNKNQMAFQAVPAPDKPRILHGFTGSLHALQHVPDVEAQSSLVNPNRSLSQYSIFPDPPLLFPDPLLVPHSFPRPPTP